MTDELAQKPTWFQPLQDVAKQAMRLILATLTPALCLACKTSVQDSSCLCTTCWQKLAVLDDPVCDMLGIPFAYDQGKGALSVEALNNPPVWDRARAALTFDDVSREIIHAFKYGDHAEAGLFMVRLMAQAGRSLIAESDIIIPVPLHWTRLWMRRFNQAAFLAQRLAKTNDKTYAPFLLKRIRATKPQVGLDAKARQKNLRQAFAVNQADTLRGKCILLVDDVRTTGTTLRACTEALKLAGAKQVNVLSFALVNKPFQPHI